ncbi:hypothetical protein [Pseudodesulfovibrio indicus]|uniref:Histidine kinase n=1 Tax=Pseudodesulfovibrio indicus TaxID=1716143 RepID=A0A126QRA2_9BACT|nr:hypothetical protein [Pseudodesulfovibrio indicus]AMK12288.1 hypothetical protein AWY79_14820 [Pseudodesulfovibrio indicus]TDT86503.1 hypothetical protein EDC59_1127 [Pseudodesulfovibrio indicus]
MLFLQFVFILAGGAVAWMALLMWRADSREPLPGVTLWIVGFTAVGAASAASGVAYWVGDWARGFASHLLLTGGMGLVWLGIRLFLHGRVGLLVFLFVGGLLIGECVGIYWFFFVRESYQERLTITCVTLLLLSMSMAMNLFYAQLGERAVTAAGLCYCLFALLNGLRTITILINPDNLRYFLSGGVSSVVTVLMVVSLIAAQAAHLRMIHDARLEDAEEPE